MDAITLTVGICLIADANVCKDVEFPLDSESVTPYQCMMKGQQYISQVMVRFPGWRVTNYKCGKSQIDANNWKIEYRIPT